MRGKWRNLKAVATQLLCYMIVLLSTKNEKNIEPFEHERHAFGSRFNLNLELRIRNWS